MSLIRINRHPSAKDLRIFAILWLLFLGGFGLLAQIRGHTSIAVALLALAFSIGGLGLVFPTGIRWVYLAAIYASFPIGFAVSHLVLGAIYFLLLTPIGLARRAFGHDPLTRKFEPQRKSYWERRPDQPEPGSYLKQH